MASRTAGYGPQCTISNVGGKVAVTFPAYGFDWELYNDIAVDSSHYIYNQTRTASSAITAKSGSESAGYTFVTALDYAGTTWVNTDRCVPTLQAAANDYTTIALAGAAMSTMDIMIIWYAATTNRIYHLGAGMTVSAKAFSFYGGLSKGRVTQYSYLYQFSGNLSTQTSQVYARNITILGTNTTAAAGYNPSVAGAGIRNSRMVVIGNGGSTYAFTINSTQTANTCQFDNCIVFGVYQAFTVTSAQKFYFCDAIACSNAGFRLGNVASTVTNCVAAWCLYDFLDMTNVTLTTSASTDASGNLGFRSLTDTSFDWWRDNDNNFFVPSFRILTTSALYGTGTAVGGLTTDIDGTTRANPPSIGAHEGTTTAYPATGGTISGTFTATKHASQNQIVLDLTGLTQTGGTFWVMALRAGATPVGSEETYLTQFRWPVATTAPTFMQNIDSSQVNDDALLYITIGVESSVGVRTWLGGTAVTITPHSYLVIK